ncbi:sugar ABC transporter substrate-binding protein [Acidisphaera rubrifaciens]|uniref:ABC transporter ribose permease n=1 Tax=Acidisphaera rubrifaciens HS-AP3 TaxID=1231350 RepID=A0A0D6P7W1_9PROT|nr:sugar ABC transporter substrate-binding protein [Acidisphaera rubrifaciens]GAN77431.1 ABC transporter ribose permease [Acidisphaera rubrifaciens HS-AP3]
MRSRVWFGRVLPALFGITLLAFGVARADGIDDPLRAPTLNAFKGKTVAFLPLSMGFDLTEGWGAMMKHQADELGYKFEIRDPNWNTDAGAQALTQLISEKPDIIVVHNPDVQSYARLLKKAEAAGIAIIQVNMKSATPTQYYVGADWIGLGERAANEVVKACAPGKGPSTKIAIVQGALTAAASIYQIKGVDNVLSKHPEIKVVSNQAADWDASKARAVTQTVLQQNPDLCGIIGFWDGQDTGTGAAIREAGKTGKVFLITSGGGAKSACENLENGTFSADTSYDVPGQGRDINSAIRAILEDKAATKDLRVVLYTPLRVLTKADVKPGACWTPQSLFE